MNTVDVEQIFRDVEAKLIKIITEMSYQKGRSSKFSIISAYAYTREKVTQKMLQEITGFSRGTISTSLKKLVSDKVLVKQYNPELRQHVYHISGTLASILGGSTANIGGYFASISVKLKEVGQKLQQEGMETKRGYENIQNFIKEMQILIPAYDHVMKKYQPNPNGQ
jgi:DNA-binding transcriptional regulator GbsR (MarR family)